MSYSNIESDYTPKDFLQKLLGKPFSPEPLAEESIKPKAENSNSQSTIDDILPSQPTQVFSPKSIHPKRIHFQSVQNIPGLEKREDQIAKYEPKASFQFKENLKQKSLKKQLPESQSTKELFIGSLNSFKSESHVNVDFLFVGKNQNSIETQQNLIFQKTKLILKSLLKNKFQESQILSIINSVQSGIQNTIEFDNLVTSSSNLESSRKDLSVNQNERLNQKAKKRSKSAEVLEINFLASSRRVKSCEKTKNQKLSKKQKKNLVQKSKQQILKSVKKMKQLVFLNEKSLKRTRRN